MREKTRQLQVVLLVAMYMLYVKGEARPPKRQVLAFIKMYRLAMFPDEDLKKRHPWDSEEIWRNSLAWKRKDLYIKELIWSPAHGEWALTETGRKALQRYRGMWLKLADAEFAQAHFNRYEYFTKELLVWMYRIASGDDLKRDSKSVTVFDNPARWRSQYFVDY